MQNTVEEKSNKKIHPVLRLIIEMGSIIFLFYSNLFMGEFTRAHIRQGNTFMHAISDIFTLDNFVIALVAAFVGYIVFEFFRNKI